MAYPSFTSLLRRLIPSRQLVPGDLINDMNDALYSYQNLVAGGAIQALASLINAANVNIDAASAAGGVLLPPAKAGSVISILNNSLNTTTVYGRGTDTVQTTGTTYAASVTMATLTSNVFRCIKDGFWQRMATA